MNLMGREPGRAAPAAARPSPAVDSRSRRSAPHPALRRPSRRVALLPRVAGVAGALAAAAALAGAGTAQAADQCPNAQFRTGPSALLPDCRAYELVSPADKDGATLQYGLGSAGGTVGFSSPDANHFSFSAVPPFAGPKSPTASIVVARRTLGGWSSENIAPYGCVELAQSDDTITPAGFSDDFSIAVLRAPASQGCAVGDEAGEDVYLRRSAGVLEWLSHNGGAKVLDVDARAAGSSGDAGHVLFATAERLVLPLDDGRASGSGLYDRTGGRALPVALGDDGELLNACGAEIGSYRRSSGAVSSDGRVVLFTTGATESVSGCSPATDDGGQLYARIDARRTVQVSRSLRSTSDPSGRRAPAFLAATRDGGKAYFRSAEMLTDDALPGGGIYRYDLTPVLAGEAAEGRLSFIGGGQVGGVSGIAMAGLSADGERVYFVSTSALVAGATAGESNIYLSDHGRLSYIATPRSFSPVSAPSLATVSHDGTTMAYLAEGPAGTREVYRYDADHPDVPLCVSCGPSPMMPSEDARFYAPPAALVELRPTPLRFATDDGRVFFNSARQLTAGDANDSYDVYEYANGRPRLLSGGTGSYDALLMGASDDGRDVFFATNDGLVARDFDNGDQDIYTARVGGGFAQPEEASQCVGSACRRLPSVPPAPPSAATSDFAGAGNLMPERPAAESPSRFTVDRVRRVAQRRLARRGRLTVVTRVRSAGRVSVVLRVRTGRRWARVAAGRGTTAAAGRVRVGLRLSRRARVRVRRQLARHTRLRARVTVRWSHARRPRQVAFALWRGWLRDGRRGARPQSRRASRQPVERMREAGR